MTGYVIPVTPPMRAVGETIYYEFLLLSINQVCIEFDHLISYDSDYLLIESDLRLL